MLYSNFFLQMVKSNAQRCKESRDRKRARDPEKYLKDERDRSMARYVPTAQLTPEAREERNTKGKESMAAQRAGLAPPRPKFPAAGPVDPAAGPVDPAAGPVDPAPGPADPAPGPVAAPPAGPVAGPSASARETVRTRLQAIMLCCFKCNIFMKMKIIMRRKW